MQSTSANRGGYVLSLGEVQHLQIRVANFRKKAKIGDLTPQTIEEYTRRNDQLQAGVDLGTSAKNEKYLFKAAGEWGFKYKMQVLLKEADKVRSQKGVMEAVRMLGWKAKVEEMEALASKWAEFSANPVWKAKPERVIRKQADHKKTPASDAQMAAFHATSAAQKSMYRNHFIAAEFCGARPEEFGGKGVGVELVKYRDSLALRFWIEGAKQKADGTTGQPLRTATVPVPKNAAPEVRKRWQELARQAQEAPNRQFVLTVKATKGGTTAGQKLSRGFSNVVAKMQVPGGLSMYSLRNRFSAQAKESNEDAEDVAVLLGHQSTETQRFYGRARRSGSGVSPVELINDGTGRPVPVRNHRNKKANPVVKPTTTPRIGSGVSVASWRVSHSAQSQSVKPPKPPTAR